MTTVLIENIDRATYSHLPPIIHTDSQCTHSWRSRTDRVLSKLKLLPAAGITHNQKKIFKVSGGWITGAGDLDILLRFVEGMSLDIWDKPEWDYHSDVFYVTKLGKLYFVSPVDDEDNVGIQNWVWKRFEMGEGKGKFVCSGSGGDYCVEAYSVSNMVADSAIKYAAKFDPFTNDIIQCNIDLRDNLDISCEVSK